MKDIIGKNFKLELLLLGLGIMLGALSFSSKVVLPQFSQCLEESVISGISNIYGIAIGIYATVITVIATSVMGISKALLEQKMDQHLLAKGYVGVVECLLSIIMGILGSIERNLYALAYIIISLVALVTFLKFLRTILLLYRANIQAIVSAIDAEEKYKEEILMKLDTIEHQTKNK